MAITLRELIYSKCIEDEHIHQKLIHISQSKSWIEDLIDLVIEMNDSDEIKDLNDIINSLEDEKNTLQEREEQLEIQIKELERDLEELRETNKR